MFLNYYEAFINLFKILLINFYSYEHVAPSLPYEKVKASMKYWRRKAFPANPNTLGQFLAQLREPCNNHLRSYNSSEMLIADVKDQDDNLHMIFWDQQFVGEVMRGATKIFIDGTFQTTPRVVDAYQLVTIMAVRYNHVSKISAASLLIILI